MQPLHDSRWFKVVAIVPDASNARLDLRQYGWRAREAGAILSLTAKPFDQEAEMTLDEVMAELEAARSEQIATIYSRRNPKARVMGVRFADLYRIAKKIKKDDVLGRQLWAVPEFEPRYLALGAITPASVTESEIDAWVLELDTPIMSDVFANVVYRTPWARDRMTTWTRSDADYVRRAGYCLLYDFAADPDSSLTDKQALAHLKRIGEEIQASPNWSREMMNMVSIAIGKRDAGLFQPALDTATGYGKIDVFHGEKTNCKVINAVDSLNDPRTKVKPPK